MSTTTTESALPWVLPPLATESESGAGGRETFLADVGVRLSQAATNSANEEEAVQAVLQALLAGGRASAVFRLVQREGQWTLADQFTATDSISPALPAAAFAGAAEAAVAQSRAVQFGLRGEGGLTVVAVAPLATSDRMPAVVGVAWAHAAPGPDARVLVAQLAAICLVQIELSGAQQLAGTAALQAAALVELVLQLQQAATLEQASAQLVRSLQVFLSARQLAIGWSPRSGKPCRLRALSDLQTFDRHTDTCRAYASALNESRLHTGCLVWSADDATAPPATKALARLATLTGSRTVIGLPLAAEGQPAGALLVLDPASPLSRSDQERFLAAASPVLAGCLTQIHRAEPGRLQRAVRAVLPRRRRWRCAIAAAVLTVAVVLILPWPHTVSVRCRLEPVQRRFVAVPFAGTLERSLVLPGDQVAPGQILALLDGRELRWELSGLDAEYSRTEKQQGVAVVRQESAAAQLAQLELQRIDLKRKLVAHRMANLEVRSPLAGIVVSGDLSKAQHAPVETGQTLFEVAPLDAMVAELAVGEANVAYVQPGQETRLTFDAWPRDTWTGPIALLRPRAEQRDGDTIFVAEVRLDNHLGQLRPGMSGRARIVAPDRSIGWILFHKPAEAICRLVGW